MNENIRNIRKKKKLTQKDAADLCGMPLRTYQNYENLDKKKESLKYEYIVQKLKEYDRYTKVNGVYKTKEIKDITDEIFPKFHLDFAILVGDYSFSKATSSSSIDLIIGKRDFAPSKLNELKKELENTLYKKIVLIHYEVLLNDKKLLSNTLSKGVRIYG